MDTKNYFDTDDYNENVLQGDFSHKYIYLNVQIKELAFLSIANICEILM